MTDLLAPMPLASVVSSILSPGLALLPIKMDTLEARVMLLTIGQQESLFKFRRQTGNGPARGFWQFERGGSVKGVMNHPATTGFVHNLCEHFGIPFDLDALYAELEANDLLACALARLNLWWAPGALPSVADYDGSWHLYADVTWRPGKPKRDTWNGYHDRARAALGV